VFELYNSTQFQSHAGSIEARIARRRLERSENCFNPTLVRLRLPLTDYIPRDIAGFQSHAGSIEARPQPSPNGVQDRFNPTLVRLRPAGREVEGGRRCCFNPTLVRLRRILLCEDPAEIFRFNPTLVRLRPAPDLRLHPGGGLCFNPTLVRLRREERSHPPGRVLRFNPTLVRLRREVGVGKNLSSGVFQSHAGSIEA